MMMIIIIIIITIIIIIIIIITARFSKIQIQKQNRGSVLNKGVWLVLKS